MSAPANAMRRLSESAGDGGVPGAPVEHRSARMWRRTYVVAAVVIGLASAIIRPPLGGIDEPRHFVRAVTLGHGLVVPATGDRMATGSRISTCEQMFMHGMYGIFVSVSPTGRPEFGAQLSGYECPPGSTGPASVASSRSPAADINPPLAYVPAAVGYRVGRMFTGILESLLVARILQLAVAVALTWLALRVLPRGHALFATVALVPAIVQVNGTISADPVSNAVALLWLAAVFRTLEDTTTGGVAPDRRRMVFLAVIALGLALCKPALVPLLGVVFAVPRVRESMRRHVLRLGSVIAPAVVVVVGWQVGVASRIAIVDKATGTDSVAASHHVLTHPLSVLWASLRGLTSPEQLHTVLDQMVRFGVWPRRIALPGGVTFVAVVALVAIGLAWWGSRGSGSFTVRRSRRRIAVVAVVVVLELLAIQYGLAVIYAAPGAKVITGLQGRYLLPLVPLAYLATRPRTDGPTSVMRTGAVIGCGLVVATNIWALTAVATTFYR